ncbi:MAG TPA: SRPBCC family protein, partial [Acidimicrobiales bacterium]|nr:SRPBCC family protein [Acidimicrobiales bacterium]
MAHVRATTEVERPVTTVYNQWTQFEDFPQFMEGVEKVTQLDDKRLHWVARIGPFQREWDAEIVSQTPDQGVAWRSVNGADNAGTVTFRPLGADRTEVTLELTFDPETATDKVGDALDIVE